MTQETLDRILDLLSPDELRSRVALPWDEIREEFIPRFLSVDSYDEFISEVGRFVAHAHRRWFSIDWEWPANRAEGEARQLIDKTIGIETAMRAARYGNHGGMRRVLDTLAQTLQQHALNQYLNHQVLPLIHQLDADKSIELARAYLREFQGPGLEVESTTAIAAKWSTVMRKHSHLVIT